MTTRKCGTRANLTTQQRNHLRRNIIHVRKTNDFTQGELAKKIKRQNHIVSAIERRGQCSLETLESVAKVLNTSIEKLISGPMNGAAKLTRRAKRTRKARNVPVVPVVKPTKVEGQIVFDDEVTFRLGAGGEMTMTVSDVNFLVAGPEGKTVTIQVED